MSKKIQLYIPTPCHENWDNMSPVDKGRFCMSCQKKVIDFTGMNDEQLIAYLKKPAASTCGRFDESQLNRDINVLQKRIPWMKYFFQFALPAFLVSMKADAQKQMVKGKMATYSKQNMITGDTIISIRRNPVQQTKVIDGVVVDNSDLPVPYASVMVKDTKRGVRADSLGKFSIDIEDDSVLTLSVNSVGFESLDQQITASQYIRGSILKFSLTPLSLGEVVVAGNICNRSTLGLFKSVIVVRSTNMLIDSLKPLFTKFSIYPNPVTINQTITIENKKLPEDIYDIEFINLAGQTINKQQLFMGKKDKIYPKVHVSSAGIYFIRLTGSKSSKVYTEKIIVQ